MKVNDPRKRTPLSLDDELVLLLQVERDGSVLDVDCTQRFGRRGLGLALSAIEKQLGSAFLENVPLFPLGLEAAEC